MPTQPYSTVPVTLQSGFPFSATVTGEHVIFDTLPTPFMPIFLIVMLRQVAGFTSVPTISIGTNEAVNNILPATAMTGLDANGEYARLPLGTALANGVFRGMSSSSSVTIKAKVTVAAVASAYDIELQVVGAYV